MKKQILQTVLGISILPASAFGAPAAEGFDMAFCDRYEMHNTPTYSTLCQDANLYDSHMAEVKVRSFQALMRYLWKKAKSNDRRAAFTDAEFGSYAGMYAQHQENNRSADHKRLKNTAQDVRETTNGLFKDARYRLRVSRHKFIMKMSVKF